MDPQDLFDLGPEDQVPTQNPEAQEMLQAVQDLKEKFDAKMREITSERISNDNMLNTQREQVLKLVLQELHDAGIDPGDQVKINEFLQTLKNMDLDLYEMFTSAVDGLMGGPGQSDIIQTPVASPQAPQGLPQGIPQAMGQSQMGQSQMGQPQMGQAPAGQFPGLASMGQ